MAVILIAVMMVSPQLMAKDKQTGQPIQFSLGGQWPAGETHLQDSNSHPRSFVIPDGASLVIRYVSCQALVDPGTSVFIHFIVESGGTAALSIIPTARSGFSSSQERIAATEITEIYLGITPDIGPALGNEITIFGQRESTIASGLMSCSLSGEFTMP